jgi:hypothetical protein
VRRVTRRARRPNLDQSWNYDGRFLRNAEKLPVHYEKLVLVALSGSAVGQTWEPQPVGTEFQTTKFG